MHIKHVILDGFKSYMDKTEIGPFDPHFNAITGLNGSGKSNILDGISFALGLSSLAHVRAATLKDLVHKGAGVTRCTVSIVFDNTNKKPGSCPLGYEKYDEIIVSRTIEPGSICKYFLNSLVATKKQIQDLFESVQLNINNPNFIIMQGKITKVVNMKPKEILHMIEETVGASVYQNKRDKADKDLTDKNRMIENINSLMEESIIPAKMKQQQAKEHEERYNILSTEIAKKDCDLAINLYVHHKKEKVTIEKKLNEFANIATDDLNAIQELKNAIKAKNGRLEDMKKESVNKFDQELKKLDDLQQKEKGAFDIIDAEVEEMKAGVTQAAAQVKKAEKAKEKETRNFEKFKKESEKLLGEFNGLKEQMKTAEDELKAAKEAETQLDSGKVLNDGKTIDIQDELIRAERELGEILPRHEEEQVLLKTETLALKEKSNKLANTANDKDIEADLKTAQDKVNKMKAELKAKNIDPNEAASLNDVLHEARTRRNQAKQTIDMKTREDNRFKFDYTTPPNFNPNGVFGCLFEHFTVNDLAKFGGAIDVGCGGSIFVVLVDKPATSAALIKFGNLSTRRNFMPLDQIQDRQTLNQEALDRKLGPGKAYSALELIDFDPRFLKVMKQYFGFVVCEDMATAKIVAYQLRTKAITLDGDVVDPDGIMQGGTRRNLGKNISIANDIRNLNMELRELEGKIRKLEMRLQNCQRNDKFLQEYAIAEKQLQNCIQTRNLTDTACLEAEVAALTESTKRRQEFIKESMKEVGKRKGEIKTLKDQMMNMSKLKNDSRKQIANRIKKATAALAAANDKYNIKKKSFDEIDLELKAKEDFLQGLQADIEREKEEERNASERERAKIVQWEQIKKVFDTAEAKLKKAQEERDSWGREREALANEINDNEAEINKIECEKEKRGHEEKEIRARLDGLEREMNEMEEKHRNMNFNEEMEPPSRKSIELLKREVAHMNKKLEEMRVKLDKESADMLQSTNDAVLQSENKIKRITSNKIKIEAAIDELDKQKLDIVSNAYNRVNDEFNTMMSTLLPGSQARLVRANPDDLSEGLNIHVCLGGVWKESLTELSGGQRSLVALALVLSLCMYSPAPFYILDEIDAALDMSHTQNIGCLIKQKFTGTQFVCVSLKDGMYSNANILFQTNFVNGKSTVRRNVRKETVQKTSSHHHKMKKPRI